MSMECLQNREQEADAPSQGMCMPAAVIPEPAESIRFVALGKCFCSGTFSSFSDTKEIVHILSIRINDCQVVFKQLYFI